MPPRSASTSIPNVLKNSSRCIHNGCSTRLVGGLPKVCYMQPIDACLHFTSRCLKLNPKIVLGLLLQSLLQFFSKNVFPRRLQECILQSPIALLKILRDGLQIVLQKVLQMMSMAYSNWGMRLQGCLQEFCTISLLLKWIQYCSCKMSSLYCCTIGLFQNRTQITLPNHPSSCLQRGVWIWFSSYA